MDTCLYRARARSPPLVLLYSTSLSPPPFRASTTPGSSKRLSVRLRTSNVESTYTLLLAFNRFKTMASSTMVIKFAVIFLAVISSMAVAANGQAPGPAPPPQSGGAGASAMPTIVAPAMALFLAFGLGRMLW